MSTVCVGVCALTKVQISEIVHVYTPFMLYYSMHGAECVQTMHIIIAGGHVRAAVLFLRRCVDEVGVEVSRTLRDRLRGVPLRCCTASDGTLTNRDRQRTKDAASNFCKVHETKTRTKGSICFLQCRLGASRCFRLILNTFFSKM